MLLPDLFGRAVDRSHAGPARLLGIEHEYELRKPDELVDAREHIHSIARLSNQPIHRAGPYGYFLRNGPLFICDGREAEVATALTEAEAGVSTYLSHLAQADEGMVAELLERYNRTCSRQLFFKGYSTHLNAYSPIHNNTLVCRTYAHTMAPAMMMLMDLRTSPGLLVRPRRNRFEVGGDYVAPGDNLTVAVAFFLGSYLAVLDAVSRGQIDQLPFVFSPDSVQPAVVRFGFYAPRDAFGSDLYASGRNAQLQLKNKTAVSAQRVLEESWSYVLPYVKGLLTPEEKDLVTRTIYGDRALPLEVEDTQSYFRIKARPVLQVQPRGLTDCFFKALEGHRGPDFSYHPELVHWDFILFRIENCSTSAYLNVPRQFLKQFAALVEHRIFNDRIRALLASGSELGSLDTLEMVQSPGIFREFSEPPLTPEFQTAGKTKKKKHQPQGCRVEKIAEETETQPPIIRICLWSTTEALELSPRHKQEPPTNSVMGGMGIHLQSGAYQHIEQDLQVRAIGFDFEFVRTYRSSIQFNGLAGHNWDFFYNKRVVPTMGVDLLLIDNGFCETYSGEFGPPGGDITYYDGTGRKTFHAFKSWNHRTVQRCGPSGLETFKAVVTTYRQNPGEEFEFERYAIYEGSTAWGEPIFYICRHKDGSEYIFNCHGYIIAMRDANLNTMWFFYGLPFNPTTGYLVLRTIVDTSGRRYTLDYNLVGGVIRLVSLTDEDGRTVRYEYNPNGELNLVYYPSGQHAENKRRYEYGGGRLGILTAVYDPSEADGGQPTVKNSYNTEERVYEQKVGDFTNRIEYDGEVVKKITDVRGIATEYKMVSKHDTYVLEEMKVINSQPASIPGVNVPTPPDFITRYEYNDDFLILTATYPDGRKDVFEYQPANRPITIGDERDWVERDLTFVSDLSKGNMLKRTQVPNPPSAGSVVQKWEYEHRYNQITRTAGPLGETLYDYAVPSCVRPDTNANPLKVTHPPLLQPDGTRRTFEQTFKYRAGGLVEEHVDGDGVRTTFEYHRSGAIERMVVDPGNLGLTTEVQFDGRGNPLKTTDAEGHSKSFTFDNRNNLETKTDELSHETRCFYDKNDNLIRMEEDVSDDPATFALSSASFSGTVVTSMEYDVLDQLERMVVDVGGLNLETKYKYDGDGNLTREEEPSSAGSPLVRTTTYETRGLAYRETAAVGTPEEKTTYYAYDEAGNITHLLTPGGALWSYSYDGRGYLEETLSPTGNQTKIKRNLAGQPTRVQIFGPLGGPTPTSPTTTGNVLLSDAITIFDAMYNIVQETSLRFDPARGFAGGVSRSRTGYFHRTDGQLEELVDAENRRTRKKYDTAGRLEQIEHPAGHLTRYTLDGNGFVTRQEVIERPEGAFFFRPPRPIRKVTTYKFDALGRISEEFSRSSGRTFFAYDSRGLMRGVKLPGGAQEEFAYDSAGRKLEQILRIDPGLFNPSGEIRTKTTYADAGQPHTITDGLGHTTTLDYDHLGRVKTVTDPDGVASTAQYSADGLPILIRGRGGEEISMGYDLLGRPIEKHHLNPAAQPVSQSFEYNGLGHVTKIEDRDGSDLVTTERSYDSMGLLLSETQDGNQVSFDYDLTGRNTYVRYPSGMELYITQTPSGKIDSYSRSSGLIAQYNYLGDRPVERVAPSILTDPQTGTFNVFSLVRLYSYNRDGLLESFAHLVHDDVTNPSNPINRYFVLPLRMNYDQKGRLKRKRSADYALEYSYDKADRLIQTVADPVYDRMGIRREVITSHFDAGHNLRRTERVITESLGQQRTVITDLNQNALNAVSSSVMTPSAGTPQTSGYLYHRSGSLFQSDYENRSRRFGTVRIAGKRNLFFDAFGRLNMVFIESSQPNTPNWRIRYRYDGFGRRILRVQEQVIGPSNTVIDTQMTRYLFWGDRCIEEWERTSLTQPWIPARRFYHGVSQNELLAMDVREDYVLEDINNDGQMQGGTTLLFANDHEQSPLALLRLEYTGTRFPFVYERYLIDSAGNTDRFSVDPQGNFRFITASGTGHAVAQHGRWQHDNEGLYYGGRRFYDPDTGTFVSRDPSGPWGDISSLGNAYAYAGNDSANQMDSSGFVAESVWDAASLGIGIYSISQWNEKTTTFEKALDVFGVAVDAVALVLPFVPGGVGAGLKAYRAAKTIAGAKKTYQAFDSIQDAYSAMKLGKKVERGLNTLQAADAGFNAVNAYDTFLETGSPLSAMFAMVGGVAALRSARAAYLGICFPGDTQVSTLDGYKPIGSLKEQDEVLSYDQITDSFIVRPVEAVIVSKARSMVELTVVDARGFPLELTVTTGHPFLVEGQDVWVRAKDLKPRQQLRFLGGLATVERVERREYESDLPVYNLQVSGTHTYLVSRLGIVVHNACAFEEVISQGMKIKRGPRAGMGKATRLRRLNHAVTSKSGKPIEWREMIGVDYTIQKIEALGYRLVGAGKTSGNQGIDLIFEGIGQNAGRYALAEAKASKGLSALKKDTKGIRQGSYDFFLSRLDLAGPEWSHVRALLAGNSGLVDLFGGFAGGLVRGKAKLKANGFGFPDGKLFRFNPHHFKRNVSFRKTPQAATIV